MELFTTLNDEPYNGGNESSVPFMALFLKYEADNREKYQN